MKGGAISWLKMWSLTWEDGCPLGLLVEGKWFLKLDLADSLVKTKLNGVATVQSAGSGADVTACKFKKAILLLLHLMQVFEQVG